MGLSTCTFHSLAVLLRKIIIDIPGTVKQRGAEGNISLVNAWLYPTVLGSVRGDSMSEGSVDTDSKLLERHLTPNPTRHKRMATRHT